MKVVLKEKNRKEAGLDKIPQKYGKPGNSTICCTDIVMPYIVKTQLTDGQRDASHFPKKGDLGLAKNYRGMTLTSIAAKIYNALLRNRIEPKIENTLRKNQNSFRRNRSRTSQILTIR